MLSTSNISFEARIPQGAKKAAKAAASRVLPKAAPKVAKGTGKAAEGFVRRNYEKAKAAGSSLFESISNGAKKAYNYTKEHAQQALAATREFIKKSPILSTFLAFGAGAAVAGTTEHQIHKHQAVEVICTD